MKRTVISLGSRTEHHLISNKLYQIDRRLERRGSRIYLDRSFVRHESIAGIRTVLIPDQNLWVIFFEGHREPYELQCYMHMALIHDQSTRLLVEDLYLDVLIHADGRWEIVDIDEFRQAMARGELSPEQVQAALIGLENACRLVREHGSHIEAHLRAVPV